MWKGNIKIYFNEIGWEGVEWINRAHDVDKWQAVVNTVMNLWVYKMQGFFFFLTRWGIVSISKRTLLCGVSTKQ